MRGDGERAYRLLLRLYPRDFRARYGRAMADFHRDRVRAAREANESMAALWMRTAADVARSAMAERLQSSHRQERPMTPLVHPTVQDLAYALRGLARRPAFSLVVVATIALGVGANAAIFSVVNGVLLAPLPYPDADRVIAFGHEPPQWLTSEPGFLDYKRDMRTLDGLAAYTQSEATLSGGDGEPERLRFVRASEDFFPLLGVPPMLGRTFAGDEFATNPPAVVVLSHGLWQRRYGADSSVVGRAISINGVPRTVVGVMPPRFDFPEARTDVWAPLRRFNPDSVGTMRTNHYLWMVGRVKAGVPLARAVTEARTIAARAMRDYPQMYDPAAPLVPKIEPVPDRLVGGTRPYLLALLGAVGFVLLIACANVANLLLVRGESRRKEMALRSALGASGSRLLGQLLTESALLALLGGALGLALAWGGVRALVAAAPASIPRLDAIAMDWRVVAFTFAVAVLTGLAVGIVPALRAAREHAAEALKDGAKVALGQGGAPRARRLLVVAEVALAVTMLSGAGMLLRSLWHLQRDDLGFDPRGVLTAKVSISQRDYDDARTAEFFAALVERLRAVPGVRSVGAAGWLPVVDAGGLWGFRPEGGNYPDGRWPAAVPQQVTPGYRAAVGLALLAGRDIAATDRAGAPAVAVVSRKFAELAWPGQDPIGRRFGLGNDRPPVTVVGVVGDIRARGFGDAPEPTMYFPHAQAGTSAYYVPRAMALAVRTTGADAAAIAPAVRRVVRALDAMAPVSEVRTLEQVVGTSIANRRFTTGLLAGFAALALVLAGIGTYGVISYGVSQRTFEIGVRMALGAERRSVLLLVMSEGMRLCVVGLVLGLAASVGLGRLIRAMLVGVSIVDAPTLAATSALLVVVTVVASVIPARRALAVSPTSALRG